MFLIKYKLVLINKQMNKIAIQLLNRKKKNFLFLKFVISEFVWLRTHKILMRHFGFVYFYRISFELIKKINVFR